MRRFQAAHRLSEFAKSLFFGNSSSRVLKEHRQGISLTGRNSRGSGYSLAAALLAPRGIATQTRGSDHLHSCKLHRNTTVLSPSFRGVIIGDGVFFPVTVASDTVSRDPVGNQLRRYRISSIFGELHV